MSLIVAIYSGHSPKGLQLAMLTNTDICGGVSTASNSRTCWIIWIQSEDFAYYVTSELTD